VKQKPVKLNLHIPTLSEKHRVKDTYTQKQEQICAVSTTIVKSQQK